MITAETGIHSDFADFIHSHKSMTLTDTQLKQLKQLITRCLLFIWSVRKPAVATEQNRFYHHCIHK